MQQVWMNVRETTDGQEGFMALVEPVLPAAYRLAVGVLRSPSDAEDAVQDAVLKAWRHFDQFRPDAELRPWLLAIVANECRRQQRAHWWSVIKTDQIAEVRSDDQTSDPESADLRQALYRLPYDQRLAVILRYYVDLSFDDVGKTLGVSTKAAKSRVYRALDRLRLSPEVFPDE